MSRLNPKLLVGRKIVRVEMHPHVEGNGTDARTMHDPIIYLDDGSSLAFLAEEHPEGAEYGVHIIRRRKRR